MILQRFACLLVIFQFSLLMASGQGNQLSTQNKKAEKFFYAAMEAYEVKNFDRALMALKKAVGEDPQFTEAYILQGDIRAENHEYEAAITLYQTAIKTNKPFSPNLYLILANMQLNNGKYADARQNFQRLLDSDQVPETKRRQAASGIKSADFAIRAMAHPQASAPRRTTWRACSPHSRLWVRCPISMPCSRVTSPRWGRCRRWHACLTALPFPSSSSIR